MFPLSFEIGKYTIFFLILTIFPWLSSILFSFSYIEERRGEFYTFFLLTFFLNILIFFSKNLLTFLFLFELLSLFSFPLIIYERGKEAVFASKLYFMFSLLSGLFIFGGLILLQSGTQFNTLSIISITIGLLIKCGAYPFHIWLPEAHPVAPSPASAILSGCIIKIGFFGLIKLIPIINSQFLRTYGEMLLVISIITMFYGVLQALLQSNSKKMLAYHSVSQMGYILLGLSLFAISKNIDGLSGSLLHAMNHAFFKSLLFLSIGSVFLEYGSVDMYKLKGFFLRRKIISILFLTGVLGISGVPFFNGYISKTLLHEALLEEETALFKIAEIIFLLTAIGTFISNFKMYYLINFRGDKKAERPTKPNKNVISSLLILSLLVILLGLLPVIYKYFLPGYLGEEISNKLYLLMPFGQLFLEGLPGFILISIAGIFLIIFGLKIGLFHKKIPYILDPLCWCIAAYNLSISFFRNLIYKTELFIIKSFSFITRVLGGFLLFDSKFDKKILETFKIGFNFSVKKIGYSQVFDKELLYALTYSVLPGDKLLPDKVSKKAYSLNKKISTYYSNTFSFLKFLFTVANKTDLKGAKNYEHFVKINGRKLIIAFVIITIILILGFILLLIYL